MTSCPRRTTRRLRIADPLGPGSGTVRRNAQRKGGDRTEAAHLAGVGDGDVEVDGHPGIIASGGGLTPRARPRRRRRRRGRALRRCATRTLSPRRHVEAVRRGRAARPSPTFTTTCVSAPSGSTATISPALARCRRGRDVLGPDADLELRRAACLGGARKAEGARHERVARRRAPAGGSCEASRGRRRRTTSPAARRSRAACASCRSLPARMTAMRSASVIASTWSCVT